jgi:glutamate/tyrosine decarboxylase-like PLP-dependent enzyme
MEAIKELEQLARKLDPSQSERKAIWDQSQDYANQYINDLPSLPGYGYGSFDKLSSMKIEEQGKRIDQLIEVLKTEVDATGIASASGKHMGFIPGGGVWAASIADMLADTTNKYSGIAFSAPGAVKVENQVIRWLTTVVGYPAQSFGHLTSGGSIANLIAVKAARDSRGINSTNVKESVIYYGAQTHHSVNKALHITGLYEAVQRKIPLTNDFKLDLALLQQQLAEDKAAGLTPFLIIGSAGTTDTGAIDPLAELSRLATDYECWFHVDAAYGGFFMLVDEMKEKMKGIEKADSIVLDPHKTLFFPFGSGAVLLKDGNALLSSNSSRASYLVDTEDMDDISPADTGIELTRPNRGLRMWLPLQLHGIAPFRACLQEKILLTHYFYEQIQNLGFETGPTPELTVSIFRYPEGDSSRMNQQLVDAVHADGRVFLSSTIIDGKVWLRCAIVSHRTHLEDVDLALQMLRESVEKIVTGVE